MPRRPHIQDESAEYPDESRRTLLEVLGVNRGHVSLAVLALVGGGVEHFHISDSSDRVAIVEKTAEGHTKALAMMVDRLGRIETSVALCAKGNDSNSDQLRQVNASLDDMKRSLYRMEGMNRSPKDAVSLNR